MRKGHNPNKDKIVCEGGFLHQILIPVYIPNQDDYFSDSFKIFKKCLQSIFQTIDIEYTYISVVNNGSCVDVENYLLALKNENKIMIFFVFVFNEIVSHWLMRFKHEFRTC